jgi:hypothetical protein
VGALWFAAVQPIEQHSGKALECSVGAGKCAFGASGSSPRWRLAGARRLVRCWATSVFGLARRTVPRSSGEAGRPDQLLLARRWGRPLVVSLGVVSRVDVED